MLKKILNLTVILICLLALNTEFLGKHQYHTSFTRIDYNQSENLLEITIKVFAHDLLPSLEKRLKRRVDLENTKNVDEILRNYLAEKFVLKSSDNKVKPFKWLGKELETDVIIFYVEIPFNENLEDFEIKNTIFFESFKEQVNLVNIRYGENKSDLVFKAGDDFKKISENKKKR